MRLFNKKEPEEVEESRTVKFSKDGELSPRRKKTEVIQKPWGRKERSIVFFLLIATVVGSAVLAFVARRGKLPNLPALNTKSLGLTETVVFTNTQIPDYIKKSQENVVQDFVEETSKLSGIYAFSAIDLSTGQSYGVNQFTQMQAASLVKLPVMAFLLRNAEEGKVNLKSQYVLKNEDKIGGSGSLYSKAEGETYSYEQLLEYMGKQSDNTAFNVVRKLLSDQAIEEFMDGIGMTHTDLEQNITTPADISLLLKKIYEGRLIKPVYKEMLFESLTDTIYENHLPKGVDDEIVVAHKYGREIHVVNDAGVVFTKKPYVAVIMTEGIVESEADLIFSKLSRIIFEGQQKMN